MAVTPAPEATLTVCGGAGSQYPGSPLSVTV